MNRRARQRALLLSPVAMRLACTVRHVSMVASNSGTPPAALSRQFCSRTTKGHRKRGTDMTAGFVVAFIVVSGALVYMQASAIAWLAWTITWVAIGWLAGITGPIATTLLTLLFVIPTLVLAIKPLRRTLAHPTRPRPLPQDPPRDVPDRARRHRSRHRLVGRRPLLRPAALGHIARPRPSRSSRRKNSTSSTTNARASATSPTTGTRQPSGRTCRRKHGGTSRTTASSA